LKDIGIPLGHRRKILAAAGELAVTAAGTPAHAVSSEPKTAAERRQITVLFADLVGWTELSMRMDPEDLRDIIAEYQKCVSETIQRFDGFVANRREMECLRISAIQKLTKMIQGAPFTPGWTFRPE
jgi:class 3 adenylate cyclase